MANYIKKNLIACLMITCCLVVFLAIAFMVNPQNEYASAETNSVNMNFCCETYISSDNKGYSSKEQSKLPFDALTSLSYGVSKDAVVEINKTSSKNVPVIKLSNSDSFSLYLKTPDIEKGSEIKDGYTLSFDSWGSTQTGSATQPLTAQGDKTVVTGEVGTGALIVQTSRDGKNWTQSKLDKFSNGLYTTDFLKNFGGSNKNIYSPTGDDVKHGVYISVNFYYEIYRYEYIKTESYYTDAQIAFMVLSPALGCAIELSRGPQGRRDIYDNVYSNIRETYTFFVVEDNPETVTFNNLTTADTTEIIEVAKPSSEDKEQYAAEFEQYNNYLTSVISQMMPTMLNGDMTTTGVRINVTANPYLKVTLKRNGKSYALPKLQEKSGQKYYQLTEAGKYDITISSYSKYKTTTIYIDNVDSNVAYKRYFGDAVEYGDQTYGTSFLNYSPDNQYGNKRIFDSNSDVPVFKGPLTLHFSQLDNNVLPIYGYITNLSLGTTKEVTSEEFILSEYGNYELLFVTNSSYYNRAVLGNENVKLSGDVRVYTFHFKLIGNSDSSKINQYLLSTKSVCDFSVASPSDYFPVYYAVSRTTADKGRVQVAFYEENAARQYAQKVAWSEIEEFKDINGQSYWLIPDINNLAGAKIKSTSGWANARAVNAYADSILARRFFDLTEVSSYLTLDITKDELEDSGTDVASLSCASIKKTVILWADSEQRDMSISKNAEITSGAGVIAYIGRQQYAVLSGQNGTYSEINNGNSNLSLIHDYLGIDSFKVIAIGSMGETLQLAYDVDLYSQFELGGFASGIVTLLEENIYGETTAYKVYYIADGYQPGNIFIDNDVDKSVITIARIEGCIDPVSFVKIQTVDVNNNTTVNYYSLEEAQRLHISTQGITSIIISLIDRFGNTATNIL